MRNRKRIIVRLGPNGQIELEAEGFRGPQCMKETSFLEDVLGKVAVRSKKAEWHMRNGRAVRETLERTGINTTKLCG